ncbi:MAG: hypothetical protein WC050_00520 [Candidatus Paceibacterota bacterium]
MTDDLHNIDPAITEAVLANAAAFIDADTRIDEIISWGKNELKAREEQLKAKDGSLQDFKKAAADIELLVSEKLRHLEAEVRAKYPGDS